MASTTPIRPRSSPPAWTVILARSARGRRGGDAGVGATVLVGLADMTTKATLGDSSASTGATTLNLTGKALVSATTETDATSYVVGVSVGGSGAGAAQVSALIATNTTKATIQNSGVTVTGSGDVDVKSQETVAIDPTAGGLAIGGTAGRRLRRASISSCSCERRIPR